MMNGILNAEGIFKSYGEQEVLKNLNLTIEPGKIYGLIGRNGVGKTTLLSILTGQSQRNAGTVTYNGEEVWENQRALDALCFSRELSPTQFNGPNNFKVGQYIKSAAIFYPNWDKEYAQALKAEFKLEDKKKISQLSKGQMSMVTILIALASRAPITILDEPVAGLDVVMRERFYQLLLQDYTETNRTFIISTHIIEEAASVFEQILILDEGRIIENTPTDELLEQFCSISGHMEAVDRACAGLQVLTTQTLGLHKSCIVRSSPEKLAALARSGGDVTVAPVGLQSVFVALCGHGDA